MAERIDPGAIEHLFLAPTRRKNRAQTIELIGSSGPTSETTHRRCHLERQGRDGRSGEASNRRPAESAGESLVCRPVG
jgi:hypothetical protein